MALFYNQADQDIYNKGIKFLPQEKYRMGPYTPVIDQESKKIETSFGIPAASNFNNSGGSFSPSGNAFGYGTAIKPGDPYVGSFKPGDPYAGQSGYYGSPNYRGGLPGNYAQKGPGRSFQYEFTKPDEFGNLVNVATGKPATNEFYKDYTLTPRKEMPGFVKAVAPFVPFGMTAVNFIENKMNPTGPMTSDDYSGGSYGIAGLTDQQKGLYDALSSQGMLFQGPGGIKTATGKNLVSLADNYEENQIDNFNEMKADGYDFDENGNVIDGTGKIVTGYLKDKFIESYTVNNYTQQAIEKNRAQTKEIQDRVNKQETVINQRAKGRDVIDDKGNVTSSTVNPNSELGKKEGYSGGNPNPHTDTGWSGSSKSTESNRSEASDFSDDTPGTPFKHGGRVGYFYGGLANRVNYKVGGRTDAESQYGSDSVGSYDSSQNISDRPQSYGIDNNPPVSTEDNEKIVTTDFISKKPSLIIDYTDPKNYASIYSTIGFNNILDNDDLTAEGNVTGEFGPIGYTTNFTDQGITGTNLTAGNFNANISPDMQLQNLSYNRGPFSISTDGQNIGGKFSISYKNGGLASIL